MDNFGVVLVLFASPVMQGRWLLMSSPDFLQTPVVQCSDLWIICMVMKLPQFPPPQAGQEI